jgi:hypothetical protein
VIWSSAGFAQRERKWRWSHQGRTGHTGIGLSGRKTVRSTGLVMTAKPSRLVMTGAASLTPTVAIAQPTSSGHWVGYLSSHASNAPDRSGANQVSCENWGMWT